MTSAQRRFQFWYLVPCLLLLTGCVRQTMSIRSNPPGARAFINGKYAGLTPVTTDFDWYTNYAIHVEKPGYHHVDERQAVRAPWYMVIPLDLVTEALPWQVRDAREFAYELQPAAEGAASPAWSISLRDLEAKAPAEAATGAPTTESKAP